MKRTTIAVSFLLTCVFFTFTACKKEAATKEVITPENNESIPVENGRLVFKTTQDFYKHIDAAKPEQSDKAGFRSLYTALKEGYGQSGKELKLSATLDDLSKFNFLSGFLATLNEKGEVKVGDEIIWYNKGNKYFIPAGNEANLETVKKTPERIEKFIPTYISKISSRQNLDIKGLDARHQWEFWPVNPTVGSRRKFVHEIYGTFDGYYEALPGIQGYKAYLVLRLKMEWEGSSGWNAGASEERTEVVSISGFGTLPGISNTYGHYITGPNFTINDQRSTRENYDITLSSFDGIGNLTNNNWDLEINGTITSQVNGDVIANKWINSGTPLW